MPPLAAQNLSSNSDYTTFDIHSFFHTNSLIFKRILIGERTAELFEMAFASVLLILFSPLMIIVATLIKVTMPGPVLYSQIRVGKDGKLFKIFKFRSMVLNAEEKTGPVLATSNDPRITRLGKFLRASHIDELPQLFNVLFGEMSFVGPRPERPEFVNQFNDQIVNYDRRHNVKPGITGLAQICLPYDATARDKLHFDLFYIENKKSVYFNMVISYYTALKMLTFFRA